MRLYQVTLTKPATYWIDVKVEAETPEEAKRLAFAAIDEDQGMLEWDYSDPGGDAVIAYFTKNGVCGEAIEDLGEVEARELPTSEAYTGDATLDGVLVKPEPGRKQR